jgi:hypothetical protein
MWPGNRTGRVFVVFLYCFMALWTAFLGVDAVHGHRTAKAVLMFSASAGWLGWAISRVMKLFMTQQDSLSD